MPGEIKLPSYNLDIAVVGLGATGSHFLRSVCQEIATGTNDYTKILLIDGDTVDEKNIGNQLFVKEDVGEKKVHVLQDVYKSFYDVKLTSYDEYVIDLTLLKQLVPVKEKRLQVVVAAVDNNQTRQLLDTFFKSEEYPNMIYIDVGVHGMEKDNRGSYKLETGNNGQIVVGFKYESQIILEPLSTYYPNVLTDKDSPAPGCGVIVQSVPQRLMTNKFAAQLTSNIVATLIHEHKLLVSQVTFDARYTGSRPTYITIDEATTYKEIKGGYYL